MKTQRRGFSLVELLVVLGIVGLLVALLLPAIQRVRMSAAKTGCESNLRQLGLALHQYHGVYGSFPYGSFNQGDEVYLRNASWLRALLPYIEQNALWEESEAAAKIAHTGGLPPHSPGPIQKVIKTFLCPLDFIGAKPKYTKLSHAYAMTTFQGVGGAEVADNKGILFMNSAITTHQITDGTSHTLIAAERQPNFTALYGWWYDGAGRNRTGELDTWMNARETVKRVTYIDVSMCADGPYHFQAGSTESTCSTFHFWSLHPGGANGLFADGSVRFLPYSIDPLLPALCTRAGSETVEGF
jgi:prepilin-type N-terminal cleavage/methylation domain-containing protein/prepilin-type processing-associated H-X9-DG protein